MKFLLGHARVIIFFAALAPRLVMPFIGFSPMVSDSPSYLVMAEGLLAGEGFTGHDGEPTTFRPPAYPVFLTGMLALSGGKVIGVSIIQALVAAACAVVIFELLVPLLGRGRAFIGGMIFAWDPVSIPSSGVVLTEALGAALILLWFAAWIRSRRHNRISSYAWAGLLGGAVIYQTMITLLLHPLACAGRFLRAPGRLDKIVLSLMIFLIPMFAWSIRNSIVFDKATVVRSGGFGALLWATTNYDFPWLLSPYDPRGEHIFQQFDRTAEHFGEGGDHGIYMAKATKRVFAEPVMSAVRVVKASFWAWADVPGAMKTLDSRPAVKWIMRVSNILILIFAGVGLLRGRHDPGARTAAGIVLYFGIFLAPLFPIPRYFLPIRPMLAILAAFSLKKRAS